VLKARMLFLFVPERAGRREDLVLVGGGEELHGLVARRRPGPRSRILPRIE
jgi:hypothetical protein